MGVKITGELTKPTIMFCNGSIFNYRQFDPVYVPQLRKYIDDYAIVQYDYIGYGQSSDLEGDFNFVTIADQHIALMDALGIDQAHLFGLSKGSVIAHLVAAGYHDRVLSLAGYGNPNLANDASREMTTADFSTRLQHTKALTGIYKDHITKKNYKLVYDTVFVPSTFGKQLSELNLIEKLKNTWIRRQLKPMTLGPKIEIMDKLFTYYINPITEDERQRYITAMKEISVPTLLMHGTKDRTVDISSSKLLASWNQEAELEIFKGLSHSQPTLIPWEGKKIMRRYASFLRDLA